MSFLEYCLATVRIYKVAELLNTTSQEVMALLKKEHGIEVKSASSTIEEVVAREFVAKHARQPTRRRPRGQRHGNRPVEPPSRPSPPGLRCRRLDW
jgi:translation initiation factor IF-2-like protein